MAGKRNRHIVRVVIPDAHGNHIDARARAAFLQDLAKLDPEEIVATGDLLDCGGTFSTHQRTYTNEMTDAYADDVHAANAFLDDVQRAAPHADIYYLEGNHEAHVERWAARTFERRRDAEMVLERLGPAAVLQLRQRGIRYYRTSQHYMGLSIPGAIRLGKCYFIHGISHSKHADSIHLERFGANVVFGHVHRSMSVINRTVTSDAFGAWCPGTLSQLQPLYRHTNPTSWSHGYAVQLVNKATGTFMHINVPIYGGKSGLADALAALTGRRTSQ